MLHGDELRLVTDVPGQLAILRQSIKQNIKLDTRPGFSDRLEYTIDRANASGNENHFQGLAVLPDGVHYVASGSNWKTGRGDVFAFRIEAGARAGVSLLTRSLDFPFWHTGGIDCWSDLVVVPAERPRFGRDFPGRFAGRANPPESATDDSAIYFLQGATLEVQPPPLRITRPGVLATSAGLTRLHDGRFLTIVLAQTEPGRVLVDAYISLSTALHEGFPGAPVWSEQVPITTLDHYQSISLHTDESGVVFLVGLAGESRARIDAFQLGSALSPPSSWTRFESITVNVGPADCSAGGCVAALEGALRLAAIAKFRAVKSKQLVLTRFAPPLLAFAPIPLTPVG
ncbi:MAG: hypothetical protein ACRENP_18840 [Longimicrobiales bacterium]